MVWYKSYQYWSTVSMVSSGTDCLLPAIFDITFKLYINDHFEIFCITKKKKKKKNPLKNIEDQSLISTIIYFETNAI